MLTNVFVHSELQDLAICTPPDVALPATFACHDGGPARSRFLGILLHSGPLILPSPASPSPEHKHQRSQDCVYLCSPFLLLFTDNWATAADDLSQVPRSSPGTCTHHSTRAGAWLQAKIVDPVLQVIRRGAEPKQLAFSAALGVTIGIFPICGTTVILGAVAVAILGSRCNAVTVMVLNLAATPIELSLIIPFLRLGETITGSGHFPLTTDALKNVLTGHASKDVLLSIVRAMLGWLIAAPFVLAVLYAVSIPCFKVLVNRFGGIPSSPRTPIKAV